MKLSELAFPLVLVSFLTEAGPLIVPVELHPGDHYRLAFVTSASRDATDSDITKYDTFVNDAANNSDSILPSGQQWLAIATAGSGSGLVLARDHIGSITVPIFNVLGQRLGHEASDIWDGDLTHSFSYNEFGESVSGSVWTGAAKNGTVGVPSLALGETFVMTGNPNEADKEWINNDVRNSMNKLHLYGISASDLIVPSAVPEPATFGVALLGVLGMIGAMRFRSRRTS